jgi:aminopeptidase N
VTRRTAIVVTAVVVLGALGIAWAARGGDDEAAPPSSTARPTPPSTTTTTAPVVGTAGAAGVGDPYFPGFGNGGYDVAHYALELVWHPDDGVLDGVTTITATASQDLSRFNLDLVGLEVESVTVNDAEARVTRAERELEVTPAEPLAEGTTFTTIVTYRGAPQLTGEGTELFDVGWQTDGREAFVVGEPGGAATFFPVNDHPIDKATYTFDITAPADQVVVANGLPTGSQELGDGTTAWAYEAHDQLASYLVQVAIGDYELVDGGSFEGVTIRHAFHRSIADAARHATERTAEMIDVLDDVFGPYPFEAYGVLAVDERLGFALETQTLTIIGKDLAESGRGADEILLHELSHQWVGDAVSAATWKDIWLNEGFATYSQWLWSERTGGATAARRARAAVGPGLETPPGDPGADELFQVTVYDRGGMTLQALRERIGDDEFFAVLRTWIDEHRHGAASTTDFIALAERISGEELDALFEEWLYAPHLPRLP